METQKVPFDPDKRTWHPSVLPGHIVVVSTVSPAGEPNLAPKSWITMAAMAGPMIAFGCHTEHTTWQNIAATGEFVVNIPAEPLAERVWALIQHHGRERLAQSGLTLVPARQVRPPLVQECRAHLECAYESHKAFGEEIVIFGQVVAASVDAACQAGSPTDQYFSLRPIFFLENSTYGSLDTAKRVDREVPAGHRLLVVQVGELPARDLAGEHVEYLRALREQGRLMMAGPFGGGTGAACMYVISAPGPDDAAAVARQDPLVRAGATCTVRPWTRTF